ncbi:hypothetical protein Tco_1322822 [Tanacetum coccineum]
MFHLNIIIHNSEYFKDKKLLMQAQENGAVLDEERLLFLAGGQDNVIDEDVDEQPVQDLALNVDNVFQADDCDAYDSDIDEAPTAQTMFMENPPSINHDEVLPNLQEEIHEFDRLDVKLDEYGDVLKNKARLVAKGFRQEEGLDFEESCRILVILISNQEQE